MVGVNAETVKRELKQLRIFDLKELLKHYRLPVSGRKMELVDRLLQNATEKNLMEDLQERVKRGPDIPELLGPNHVIGVTGRFPALGGNDSAAQAKRYLPGQQPQAHLHHHHHFHHHVRGGGSRSPDLFDPLSAFLDANELGGTGLSPTYGNGETQEDQTHSHSLDSSAPNYYDPGFGQMRQRQTHEWNVAGTQRLTEIMQTDPFHETKKVLYAFCVLGNSYDSCDTSIPLHMDQSLNVMGDRKLRVLIYCTRLPSMAETKACVTTAAKHEWPIAMAIFVNNRPVPIVQQCSDGKHTNLATLERPASIKTFLQTDRTNLIRFVVPVNAENMGNHYGAAVVLSEEIPTESMLPKLERLPDVSTTENIKKLFSDDEVVSHKVTLQLKDPVSLTRIKTPVRGSKCDHVQCFDAANYIKFQRMGRNAKFQCFICRKGPIRPLDLKIDPWFENVLGATEKPHNVEKVELFADGSWKAVESDEEDDNDQDHSNSSVSQKRMREAESGAHASSSSSSSSSKRPNASYSTRQPDVVVISDDEP